MLQFTDPLLDPWTAIGFVRRGNQCAATNNAN